MSGLLNDRQLFNMGFNLSAQFGSEFTEANKDFAMAVIEEYRRQIGDVCREADIIKWGTARNLIGPTGEATRVGQQAKTEEEVRELSDAIAMDDKDAARDAIGDVYVTLVMQAQMWGMTMQECIDAAWNEIKDRKGRMINGVFVKEADLPEEFRT